MITEFGILTVHGQEVDVVRKKIKNLHLSVYPPTGRIRVAAPLHVNDEAVRLAVVRRLGWILRQQRKFLSQERMPPREYLTGESVYFQGRRYRLDVIEGSVPAVRIRNKKTIELVVRPRATQRTRTLIMETWYRDHLAAEVDTLISKWEPIIGVSIRQSVIQRMERKWGTCNADAGRVRLNLGLSRLALACVEYVVVHEMVHMLERKHGERFQALMDGFLPNWRMIKSSMSDIPLIG